MSYFQAVRLYSAAEMCVLIALMVVWLGHLGEEAEAVLGWTHGIGWIVLCLLVAWGAAGGSSPGRCSLPRSLR